MGENWDLGVISNWGVINNIKTCLLDWIRGHEQLYWMRGQGAQLIWDSAWPIGSVSEGDKVQGVQQQKMVQKWD